MKGLAYYRINKEDKANAGVVQKMLAQMAALRASGLEMDLVCLGWAGVYQNERLIHRFRWPVLQRRWLTFLFYFLQWPAISWRKPKLADYDFLYIRYPMMHPLLMRLLQKAKRDGLKVVLEIPTWPYDKEPQSIPHRMSLWMDRWYRSRLSSYVDLILHYGQEQQIYGIPTLRIRNGVEIHQVPFTPKKPRKKELRLIAIANWSYWHALDRLIVGLAHHQQSGAGAERPVRLRVIGEGRALASLKQQSRLFQLEAFIEFLPPSSGAALHQHIEWADMGVGTLGIHRKEVAIDSSLKHRLYCASGLPFFLSRTDLDFPSELPFVHYVADSEAAIDISELMVFYDGLSFPTVSQEMRSHAEQALSWTQKMSGLVDWLKAQ